MNELTLNDFFCGCGGMGIGFKDAGWNIVGAWDFDKFAVESYRHNVGSHVEQADIKKLTWQDIPKATAWAFGFPCQDMSVAGQQAGFKLKCKRCEFEWRHTEENIKSPECPECGSTEYEASTRSAMFFEIMRLLEETKQNAPKNLPMVLIAENVKGLKKYIPVLVEELKKHSYIAHIELYNSKFFDVAQNRERYYIVCTREDLPDTFTMPSKQEDHPVPKLSSMLDQNVDEKYYIPDYRAQKIISQALERLDKLGKIHPALTPDRVEKRQNGRRAKDDEETMFTLTAQDIHGVIVDDEPVIYQTARGKNNGNVHGIAPTVTANSYHENNMVLQPGSNNHVDCTINDRGFVNKPPQVSDIAPTLRAQDHGNIPKVVEIKQEDLESQICKETGLLNPDGVGKTLRCGGGGSLTKKHNYQHILVKSTEQ